MLERALRLPLAYVGAMGSRRTNHDRTHRLRELGVTEAELARLHAPIGLALGARTPEETAVSIAAEIVALCRGGNGTQLRHTSGPIHQQPTVDMDAHGPTDTLHEPQEERAPNPTQLPSAVISNTR